MNMAWLLVTVLLNGQPVFMEEFPPQLVEASQCGWQAQLTKQVINILFPEMHGDVYCINIRQRPEGSSDVPA